jgi:hypothetical protein
MENTEIADAAYHSLVVVIAAGVVGLLISILAVRTNKVPGLVRWMRFGEKVVLGLWLGFIAANIAILASALPYIYAQENSMRCGSLAITNFAINMIPGAMLGITFLAGMWYSGRACISANIRWRPRFRVVRWILNEGAILGGFLWFAAALSGLTGFAWFLESFTILAQNPPQLPPNLSDVQACSQFFGIASQPFKFDPFGVWFRILR